MGGKPKRSTPADRRLRANRGKAAPAPANGMPQDKTHPSMARDGMPQGAPMPTCDPKGGM